MSKALSLRMYLKHQKKGSDGFIPIYVHVTIDGDEDDFSLSRKVQAHEWDQKKQTVTSKSQEARLINAKIAQTKGDLTKLFQQIPSQQIVKAEQLKNLLFNSERELEKKQPQKDINFAVNVLAHIDAYKILAKKKKYALKHGHTGRLLDIDKEIQIQIAAVDGYRLQSSEWLDNPNIEKTLSDAIYDWLLNYLLQVQKDVASHFTLNKWISTKNKLFKFLHYRYKQKDIPLRDIELKFAQSLHDYLTLTEDVANNATMKYIKNIKQVLDRAVVYGWMQNNPLEPFKCTYVDPERQALTLEEIAVIIDKNFDNPRLREVRDVFIFCCFTGFAYQEVHSLRPNAVKIGIDKKLWINTNRNKTKNPEFLPLLPIAQDIITKYKLHPYCQKWNRLLPVNSNQKYNDYLKEIGALCGIELEITTHTARHTFATTVALEHDIPLKIVSVMMGHKTIRTTEIYARASKKAISRHMTTLQEKLFGEKRGLYVDGEMHTLDLTPAIATKSKRGQPVYLVDAKDHRPPLIPSRQ